MRHPLQLFQFTPLSERDRAGRLFFNQNVKPRPAPSVQSAHQNASQSIFRFRKSRPKRIRSHANTQSPVKQGINQVESEVRDFVIWHRR